MVARLDHAGRKFGDWTAVSYAPRRNGRTYWLCRCVCGKEVEVGAAHLMSGASTGCGHKRGVVGGKKRIPEYRAYRGMLNRCHNPHCADYPNYGGRGIEVRFSSYEEFLAHIGPRPQGTTVDRIDTNGHYEMGNVRWANMIQQNRNRRNNRLLTLDGKTLTATEWGEITGLGRPVICSRLDRPGWTVEEALTKPLQQMSPRKK